MRRVAEWARVWVRSNPAAVATVAGMAALFALLLRMPNGTLPEAAWTTMALGGLTMHLFGVRDTADDLIGLVAERDGWRPDPALLDLARANLRSEVMRALVKMFFAVVGLAALATPPPQTRQVAEWADFAGWSFLAALLLLVAESLMTRTDRARILDRLRRRLDR